MDDKKEINKDYIITSLRNQFSNYVVLVAEREAMIEELGRDNAELREELQGVKDELKRRDESAKGK